MSLFKKIICPLLLVISILFSSAAFAEGKVNIPILCYHNLNPTTPGSMNMTPAKFESQMKWLKENGFTFIPLKTAVDYLQGKPVTLPAKPVVLTDDDGWASVYDYMYPIIRKYNIPTTLFIYPETISNGKHAMTWDQLKELKQTGLFDIQGHTYSHPNFKHEKRDLSPPHFEKFVAGELVKSKKILDDKLNIHVTLLAWPFGIYNDYLEQQAAQAGYQMAFTIDAIPANRNYKPMAQPRFMIVDGLTMKTFERIANESHG
jgi:peptidoglycan/xylan/chitin deacetylase (PgdA/CDA1 family)